MENSNVTCESRYFLDKERNNCVKKRNYPESINEHIISKKKKFSKKETHLLQSNFNCLFEKLERAKEELADYKFRVCKEAARSYNQSEYARLEKQYFNLNESFPKAKEDRIHCYIQRKHAPGISMALKMLEAKEILCNNGRNVVCRDVQQRDTIARAHTFLREWIYYLKPFDRISAADYLDEFEIIDQKKVWVKLYAAVVRDIARYDPNSSNNISISLGDSSTARNKNHVLKPGEVAVNYHFVGYPKSNDVWLLINRVKGIQHIFPRAAYKESLLTMRKKEFEYSKFPMIHTSDSSNGNESPITPGTITLRSQKTYQRGGSRGDYHNMKTIDTRLIYQLTNSSTSPAILACSKSILIYDKARLEQGSTIITSDDSATVHYVSTSDVLDDEAHKAQEKGRINTNCSANKGIIDRDIHSLLILTIGARNEIVWSSQPEKCEKNSFTDGIISNTTSASEDGLKLNILRKEEKEGNRSHIHENKGNEELHNNNHIPRVVACNEKLMVLQKENVSCARSSKVKISPPIPTPANALPTPGAHASRVGILPPIPPAIVTTPRKGLSCGRPSRVRIFPPILTPTQRRNLTHPTTYICQQQHCVNMTTNPICPPIVRPFDCAPRQALHICNKYAFPTQYHNTLSKGDEEMYNRLPIPPAVTTCNENPMALLKENASCSRLSKVNTSTTSTDVPILLIGTHNGSILVPQPKRCGYGRFSLGTSFCTPSTNESATTVNSHKLNTFNEGERKGVRMHVHCNNGNEETHNNLPIPPLVTCNENLVVLQKDNVGSGRPSQVTTSDISKTIMPMATSDSFKIQDQGKCVHTESSMIPASEAISTFNFTTISDTLLHTAYDGAERVDCRLGCKSEKMGVGILPSRCIAKIRHYDEDTETYGPFHSVLSNGIEVEDLKLRLGGKLLFHPCFISNDICHSVVESVKQCKIRQYFFGPSNYPEPRVHILLHSDAREKSVSREIEGDEDNSNPGYQYHGVKLKAEPLSIATPIKELAHNLAKKYSLPGNKWNIGTDVVVYRDGKDRMGWHADDTQEEEIILCVVVQSDVVRPIKVRPKFKKGKNRPSHGDEEIWIYPSQGDAYEMDDVMQYSYVHAVAASKESSSRTVLIFRQGRATQISIDTGIKSSTLPPKRPKLTFFGHPKTGIVEGSGLYLRRELYQTCTHRADQSGVNGNQAHGCDSIVVSRQDPLLREVDNLYWLTYSSSSNQGGKALFKSYSLQKCIRVLRSSQCRTSKYAPFMSKDGKTKYRYDGLYMVKGVVNHFGETAESEPPSGHIPYTFLLVRLPQHSIDDVNGTIGNKLGLDDLWAEVCKSRSVHHLYENFMPPMPYIPFGPLKTHKSKLKMGQRVLILLDGNEAKWAIFLGLKDDCVYTIGFHESSHIFCRQSICADRLIHADPETKKRKSTAKCDDLDLEMCRACNFEYSCSLFESDQGEIMEMSHSKLHVGQRLLVLQHLDCFAYWASLISIDDLNVVVKYDGRTGKSRIGLTQIIHGIAQTKNVPKVSI